MDDLSFKELAKKHRNVLAMLLTAKLLEGSMILLAAWEFSRIVSCVFLEHVSVMEAAPHFAVLLFSMLAKSFAALGEASLCRKLSHEERLRIRRDIHTAILKGANEGHPDRNFQTLVFDSVDSFDGLFCQVLPIANSAVVLLPLCFLAMLLLDVPTAALFLLTLPIAPLLLWLIGRVTKESSQRQWKELAKLQADFAELLQGLFTLKAFRQEHSQKTSLQKLCHSFSEASLKVLQIAFVSSFALELITTLSIALIAVSIGLRLLAGHIGFDIAFFALLLAPEFYRPLRQGGTAFHIFMECRTAWENIRSLLHAAEEPPSHRRKDRIRHPPSIRADHLSFCYAGRKHPVLEDLSFRLPAGSFTVLEGSSGSGKSTLLKIMGGLLSPARGHIFLDGFPVEEIAPEDRPRHIAYVPQEPHVFSASLRDNATLFRMREDSHIQRALQQAGLGSWLSALPEGLDTLLGNGGMGLSNGQRHRLGLARAILSDAPVLLLDEITAGLDETTEQDILAFLKDFSCRRTVLFASHRPAVLKAFPGRLRLDGGILLERD